uniref:Uncharacterized protein n=1 Tax=Pararge aegeria TaxID=116150 RepID=S4PSC2_9NEOP
MATPRKDFDGILPKSFDNNTSEFPSNGRKMALRWQHLISKFDIRIAAKIYRTPSLAVTTLNYTARLGCL